MIGLNDHVLPSTGITVREAIKRAGKYWDTTGREEMRRQRDRKDDGLRDDELLRSQAPVVFGVEWNKLEFRDRARITAVWYNEFVRQELGIEQQFDSHGDPVPYKPPVQEMQTIMAAITQEGQQRGG